MFACLFASSPPIIAPISSPGRSTSLLVLSEKKKKEKKKTRGSYKPLSGHSGEAEVERCGRSRGGRGHGEEGVRFLTMEILLLSSVRSWNKDLKDLYISCSFSSSPFLSVFICIRETYMEDVEHCGEKKNAISCIFFIVKSALKS